MVEKTVSTIKVSVENESFAELSVMISSFLHEKVVRRMKSNAIIEMYFIIVVKVMIFDSSVFGLVGYFIFKLIVV